MGLISICAEAISEAPLGSENANANVPDDPLPVFGVTDTGDGITAVIVTEALPTAEETAWLVACTATVPGEGTIAGAV